jgi:Mg-chelatase subunit ChlD
MKIISVTMILVALLAGISFGQTGTVKGKVTDKTTREPVPFANVSIWIDSIQKGVAVTDLDGIFIFTTDTGEYKLRVSYVGYATFRLEKVKVEEGKTVVADIELTPSSVNLDAVEIIDYKVPLISKDMTYSSSTVRSMRGSRSSSRAYDTKVRAAADKKLVRYGGDTLLPRAGVLTAGEINDFAKWTLWKDVASGSLKQWQETWEVSPKERYTFQVINDKGKPVVDAVVTLFSDTSTLWTAHTDNTGKAELWGNLFMGKTRENCHATVAFKGKSWPVEKALKFQNGINIIEIPATCEVPAGVDILFAVDVTGSMQDELDFVKKEILGIIGQVKADYPRADLSIGSIVYRDKEDEFVVRKKEFTPDISAITEFVSGFEARGGGDTPEAVDQALDTAINAMKWRENAVSRILFLILDAPPHTRPEVLSSLKKSLTAAAAKGIFIVPVTGSGIDKSGEYLLRSMALATNGRYVFLTDHSHVGGKHLIPATDEYDVMLLNKLLQKLIGEYLYTPPCAGDSTNIKKGSDTLYVYNPKIIAHVVADASLLHRKVKSRKGVNNVVSFTDTIKTAPPDTLQLDSIQPETAIDSALLKKERFHSFKYYPNPTTGILTIEIDGKLEDLFLADLSGKLLKRYPLGHETKITIDIGTFPAGIYFIQCLAGKKWTQGRVVLVH